MAASTESSGDGADPLLCSNAEEYALDRLEESDDPLSPADLAEEYECTATHMRHTLADLVNEGEAERVARGKYVPAEDAAEESSDEDGSSSEENMASDAEYQRQHDMMTPEITEDEKGDLPADGADEESGESEESAGETDEESLVGTPEIMLILSLAAFALIVYLRMRSDGDENAESGEEQSEEEQEEETGEVPLIE